MVVCRPSTCLRRRHVISGWSSELTPASAKRSVRVRAAFVVTRGVFQNNAACTNMRGSCPIWFT
jgi:hypothetical protein